MRHSAMFRVSPRKLPRIPLVEQQREALRVETLLARARGFLAMCALIAIYFDPTSPTRYAPLAYLFLALYAVYSLLVLVLLRSGRVLNAIRGWGPFSHSVDFIWATLVTLMSEGPSSPFFVFFIFVLFASAFRWGLGGALISTLVAVSLHISEALVVSGETTLIQNEFELNRFIIRAAYLAVVGLLAGYLAEHERMHRTQLLTMSTLLQKAQGRRSFKATLHSLFGHLLHAFSAKQALMVFRENASGKALLWQVPGQSESIEYRYLNTAEEQVYFLPEKTQAAFISRTQAPRTLGHPLPEKFGALFLEKHGFQSVAAVALSFKEDATGCLFLIDPVFDFGDKESLSFLESAVTQVVPVVHNVYLFRRLRSTIGAIERGRVARELHDGVIQSLIAAEMQLEAMRRESRGRSSDEDVARVQGILRAEVVNLRRLMNELSHSELSPRQLLSFLTDTVEQFRRETGIAARFVCDEQQVSVSSLLAREVAQITREALANVRKHADARNVLVRFGSENGNWKLVIHDDGRGFGFVGRMSLEELNVEWKGPLVIKERIAAVGGDLVIESREGYGARLEITLPKVLHV